MERAERKCPICRGNITKYEQRVRAATRGKTRTATYCHWCYREFGSKHLIRGELVTLHSEWDHVRPVAAGDFGPDDIVEACQICNRLKSNYEGDEDSISRLCLMGWDELTQEQPPEKHEDVMKDVTFKPRTEQVMDMNPHHELHAAAEEAEAKARKETDEFKLTILQTGLPSDTEHSLRKTIKGKRWCVTCLKNETMLNLLQVKEYLI